MDIYTNPLFMGNFYDFMKPKMQKKFNETMHFDKLFNVLLSRFDWENIPENIPENFIEGFLLTNGTVGMTKVNGNIYAIPGSYCGDVKGYLPTEYVGVLPNVNAKQGKIGTEWIVGINNYTRMPEFILYQYASILSEIDVSEKCNILFSRFLKIPKVGSEKERIAVIDSINQILNGNISAVVSDNILKNASAFMESIPGDDFLDLVDVKEVDKLQYLNQYRDNIIKRFFQMYGQKTQVTSKMAQMSTSEIHSNDSLSLILTLQSLHCREIFCDECNKAFGLSMSVKLSECWKDEQEEMYNNVVDDTDAKINGGEKYVETENLPAEKSSE